MKQPALLKNNKIVITILTISTIVLASFFTKTTVFAQTESNSNIALTAIPPRLGENGELKVAPGEKLQVQLRVKNISAQPISTVTKAIDFIIGEDGETPIAVDSNVSNRWSLSKWLTITPTESSIAPKQTAGFNVLIEVPKDALPGGHYAMILHQPQVSKNPFTINNNSESSIEQRVGTLLYVIVDGAVNEEAYLHNFTVPNFTEYGPVNFSYTVENNSDVHIAPQMNIEIFSLFNKKVDTIKVSPKNIFPLTSRNFSAQWNRVWGAGYYKAKLTMSYGSQGAIVVANATFWLLPIKLIIAGLVTILIIVILTISIKKHLNHRAKMDQEKIAELEKKLQEINSTDEKKNHQG